MTDHLGFERPPEWNGLSESGAAESTRPIAPSPDAAAFPPNPPNPPEGAGPGPGPVPGPGPGKAIAAIVLIGLGAVLAAIVVLAMIVTLVVRTSGGAHPRRSYTPEPTIPVLPEKWKVPASALRPELSEPILIPNADGSFDTNSVISSPKTWIVFTGDKESDQIQIHGLDPNSGAQRWHLDAPQGKCARHLLNAALICAVATKSDKASGLGTSWKLMRLNPDTGAELSSAPFTGWLTLLTVQHGRLVLVEQRLPAPHAVITIVNSALVVQWRQDLAKEPRQQLLFSEDRITHGGSKIPEGPALDRPRIRQVAHGLMALWAGSATAFIDVKKKRLVALPRCSRLVDDGKRLWCNDGAMTVAYSYGFRRLYHTPLNVRLAFPYHDAREGDVTDPVFLREDTGVAVRVDLRTGKLLGRLIPTKNGSAFGMVTNPMAIYLDGVSYVSDQSTTYAVKAATGDVLWSRETPCVAADAVFGWGDQLLWAGSKVSIVNPEDGSLIKQYRLMTGYEAIIVDGALVGRGMSDLSRTQNP